MRSSSVHSGDPSPAGVGHVLDGTTTRHVRALVRGLLAGRADLVVDDAVLVADELVGNAHLHGDAPRLCRLALVNHGRRLRIEVDDASPEEPAIRTPDHTGGRGLILVDQLASSWGCTHHDDHKTVWAELTLGTPARHLAAVRT